MGAQHYWAEFIEALSLRATSVLPLCSRLASSCKHYHLPPPPLLIKPLRISIKIRTKLHTPHTLPPLATTPASSRVLRHQQRVPTSNYPIRSHCRHHTLVLAILALE